MPSTKVLNILTHIVLASVSGIQPGTGRATSDGSSKALSGIFQVQHLMNQESMLRLTLDKQLQQLRTLVYDLKSKLEHSDAMVQELKTKLEESDSKVHTFNSQLEQSEANLQTQIRNLESIISNRTETVDDKFLLFNDRDFQFAHNLSDIQNDFNTLRQTFLSKNDIDRKLNSMYERLRSNSAEQFSALAQNISDLQERQESTQEKVSVYFSATLRNHYTTSQRNEVLKYNDVIVNKGNAYQATTGVFTCPESGIYFFIFSFLGQFSEHRIHGKMTYNSVTTMVQAAAKENSPYSSAVGSILYPLKKGDTVSVKFDEARSIIRAHERISTFTGMLISEG